MATTGESLAEKFEKTNNEILSKVESLSDAQWGRTSSEGWLVGVTVHHIAESYTGLAGLVQTIATGGQVPQLTMEMINQGNAEHAIRAAGATKAETVQKLREAGAATSTMLRGLTDEQCAKTGMMPIAGFGEMSAAQAAEALLVGHGAGHFEGVKSAVA